MPGIEEDLVALLQQLLRISAQSNDILSLVFRTIQCQGRKHAGPWRGNGQHLVTWPWGTLSSCLKRLWVHRKLPRPCVEIIGVMQTENSDKCCGVWVLPEHAFTCGWMSWCQACNRESFKHFSTFILIAEQVTDWRPKHCLLTTIHT